MTKLILIVTMLACVSCQIIEIPQEIENYEVDCFELTGDYNCAE